MRSIAISTGPSQHLDHLGIFALQHSIPFIVTEEEVYLTGKKFYPEMDIIYKEIGELTPHFLVEYDLIVESDRLWAFELSTLLELLFQKKVRFAYCPHGNSDKGYSLHSHVKQDIVFMYGQHMHDLLKKTGALQHIDSYHFIGNFRYDYYLKHKSFYDDLVAKEIFSQYEKREKTVLYAPTWHTLETPTSFFEACEQLIRQLPPHYQLVIKLHPLLAKYHPSQTYHLLKRFEDEPGVLFLEEFAPIYPLLSRTDIYLGDFSSIGYDFLIFDRPMYFFNPHSHDSTCQSRFLHQCGLTLSLDHIFDAIDKTLAYNQSAFSQTRQTLYDYTFGATPQTKRVCSNLEEQYGRHRYAREDAPKDRELQ